MAFLDRSAFAVGAMLVAGTALAAAAGDMSEAQARYKQERAKCMSGQSHHRSLKAALAWPMA